MAEYKTEELRKSAADRAFEAYKEAQSVAACESAGLSSTHPIRLG